jgi:GNAT superfamily N-acetyltransferase
MNASALMTQRQISEDLTIEHARRPRFGAYSAYETTAPPFLMRARTLPDLDYVRAWLPDALEGTPEATFTVATDAVTGAVAGIAALRVFADRVGRFLLFVAQDYRRRGCGTALMESVLNMARSARVTRLLTGRSSDATADDDGTLAALAFLGVRGLSVTQEIVRYRAELKSALAVLGPLYRRYDRGPANSHRARIVTADQVDARALAAFVVRHVGGIPEKVAERLRGHGPAYCRATSMVALVDNAIVGTQLALTQGHEMFIETRAVEVAHRGGGVNLALMFRSAAAAAPLGIETIEFEHDIIESDTAKLARRFAATQVARRQCWGCPVSETAAESPVADPGSERVPAPDWRAEALRDPLVDGLGSKLLQERLFFDSANDVIQVLNERGIEGASVVNHVRGVTLHLKLVRHGPQVFNRKSRLERCLLFAVLPKSGSLYAFDTLAAGLSLDKVTICAHKFPQETINPQLVARLTVPGTICHTHADGRIGNLAPINTFLERMVVHVRDPRQAMLSAVHFLNDLRVRTGASQVAGFGLPLPHDYFGLSLTEQIDFMIEHGLPEFVRWIESWLDAAANPLLRTRLLFTRYEDLHAAPGAFFQSILDFYEVSWQSAQFEPPAAVSGSRHFRKGMTDEWRSVLTSRQREAACALVPRRVLERFGWPCV